MEPTTGLHCRYYKLAINIFTGLQGWQHCEVVIEHNLDVIRPARLYTIDMGPEGGDRGELLLPKGTHAYEEIVKRLRSLIPDGMLREMLWKKVRLSE